MQKKKHAVPRKRGKHPVKHAKRRPAAHRPAAAERPVMHRVTYASPLCGERTQAINDLLGLDNLDQLPVDSNGVVAAALPEDLQNVVFGPPDVAVTNPGTGGGTDNPGTPGTPGTPDFPGTPGFPGTPDTPIIVIPPVTPPDTGTTTPPVTPPDQPVTPPVTPPVAVVPEPSSWATMLLGMGLIGVTIRRRRKKSAAA